MQIGGEQRGVAIAEEPTISVVVPATDSPPHLGRCLAALDGVDGPDEVVVIDDDLLAGPSAARNAGAGRATGDVVMFVDADVEIGPGAVAAVREAFANRPELAAVFGTYDDDPSDRGLVSRFRNLLHHHVHATNAGEAETFWAGVGAVRRDWFDRAGGFDAERYAIPSIEDIELGTRIHDLGGEIALEPRIQGKHLKRWTLSSMVITDLFRRGVPWVELALERRQVPRVLNLGWRHRLAAALTLVAATAAPAGRPRLFASALAGLAGLHASFIGLLARRGGLGLLAAALPLLLVHHACAALSVPLGTARILARGTPGPSARERRA